MDFTIAQAIFMLLTVISCYWLLSSTTKISLYRFRNIYLASLIPCFLVLFGLVFYFKNKYGEAEIIDFVKAMPELFAQATVAAFIILCLLMAISNISLILHEGRKLKNVVGTLLEFSFILGTIAVYTLTEILGRTGILDNANGFVKFIGNFLPLWLFCLIDYFECLSLGIIIMGFIAAKQKPAYDKDFIIIPGCSINKDGGLLPLLRGRVNKAVRYAWDQEIASGKALKYIPSGGQGADEVMSEGSAMELYLLSHGAESYEVLPEKQSKNTYENFKFSKEIILKENPDAKIAFATTNYHMLRCGLLAAKLDMDVEGISSDTKWYFWPNGFARELIAIVVMSKKYHIVIGAVMGILAAIITIISMIG